MAKDIVVNINFEIADEDIDKYDIILEEFLSKMAGIGYTGIEVTERRYF